MKLRSYQIKDKKNILHALKKSNSVVLDAPTGSGKRVLFCNLAKEWAAKNKRVIILVHTNELKEQVSENLKQLNINYGFIASRIEETNQLVTIAMIRTFVKRLKSGKKYKADKIIIDEAHHSPAPYWQFILKNFPEAKHIGFSATPFRSDGVGLANSFQKLIKGVPVKELIENKYLSDFSIYAPINLQINLKGVKVIGGDFNQKQLEKRINKPFITGHAIQHYKEHCSDKSALCYCISIDHAIDTANAFKAAGINAEALHAKLEIKKRAEILESYKNGITKVLTSVDILIEGFDVPRTHAIIQLRPTYSLVRYLQLVGRGMRVHEDKKETIILDTVGNVFRFGFPDENRKYSLDGIKEFVSKGLHCPKCSHFHTQSRKCPKCGYQYPWTEKFQYTRKILWQSGSLKKLQREEIIAKNKERKARLKACSTYEDFLAFAQDYNFKNPNPWAKQMLSAYLKAKTLVKENERYCGSCNTVRLKEEFAKASHRCRDCQKKYRRAFYEKNADKEKQAAKEWTKKMPLSKVRAMKKRARDKAKEQGKLWASARYSLKKAQYNKAYLEKYKEKERLRKRAYTEKNREKIAKYKKEYRERKMAEIRARVLKADFYIPAPGKIKPLDSEAKKTLAKLIWERKQRRLNKKNENK